VAVATTGLNSHEDRVVEVAVVRFGGPGGQVSAWSSVVNPGVEVGGSSLHGLGAREVADAPGFVDVAGALVAMLGGAVVVAHNAEFVEEVLRSEFLRAGLLAPSVPAVSLGRLSQLVVDTPNHRLGTVAARLGTRHRPDGSAVAEAAAVCEVASVLLPGQMGRVVFPVPVLPEVSREAVAGVGRPRSALPPAPVVDGWLTQVMRSMSVGVVELHDARAAAYTDALVTLLSRGRVVSDEVRLLNRSAVRSGFSAEAIRGTLERFLELVRQAAFANVEVLKSGHVRHLRALAVSVGVPTYFDDLIPPPAPVAPVPGSGSFARPVRKPLPALPVERGPRCGRCLQVGHWASACPRRGVDGVGRVDPVDPV
ncbi:3'-5' exonuclease, partial [Dermatophilus congolensis]